MSGPIHQTHVVIIRVGQAEAQMREEVGGDSGLVRRQPPFGRPDEQRTSLEVGGVVELVSPPGGNLVQLGLRDGQEVGAHGPHEVALLGEIEPGPGSAEGERPQN